MLTMYSAVWGSITDAKMEWNTGAPGAINCISTMALTTSAFPITRAPPGVAGAVDPIFGMAMKPTGIPASAYTIPASMPSLS